MTNIKTYWLAARNATGKAFKRKFPLFFKLINLMLQRANWRQYQLEIGAHLLKKGCGYEVGQILKAKKIKNDVYRVKVITGIFYDFCENKINHTAENRIIKGKGKGK